MANQTGKRLVIIGGGLSGLSYLHYLRNFSAALNKDGLIGKISLIEANDYMGGSVKSRVYEDGPLHELGPRSVRFHDAKSHNTVVLLEQLGLGDKILSITKDSAAGKNRYLYNHGKLSVASISPRKLFAKLPYSKTTLAGAIYRDLFRAPKMNLDKYPFRDPPLYDFIAHRFGRDGAENLLDPIMRGITAGDARQLSTRAWFNKFLESEQTYGSIVKGIFKPPLTKMAHDELFPNDILESKLLDKFQKDHVGSYNLSTGLQTIPEYLANSLLNTDQEGIIDIYNRTKVVSIDFTSNKIESGGSCNVEVMTVDGDRIKISADHIISTLPSVDLAEILPESMPATHRNALDNLCKVPHVPVGCVCVEYRGLEKLTDVINSFGFLTHSNAGSKVLGVAFDSTMFPQIDKPFGSTRMTAMIGGAWFESVMGTNNLDKVTNSQMEQIALEEIRKIVKINQDPYRTTCLLWKKGIAQYTPGHKERLEESRRMIDELGLPITVLGQSFDGVSINDVIFSARMAAYDFMKSI